MITASCVFPYHDGWLLHDVRHDRILDERFFSSIHHDLNVVFDYCSVFCFYALHLGVSGLVPLQVSTRSSSLCFHGVFVAFLVFLPCNFRFFPDLYPKLSFLS